MAYVPNNVHVYTAAFSGTLAGMGVSDRVITGQLSINYSNLVAVAGAFAQSFDTQWGVSVGNTIDELQFTAIQEACEGAWQERAPQPNDEISTRGAHSPSRFLLPATYTNECKALVAMVQAGGVYYTAQGITPPVWPPGAAPGTGNIVVYRPGGVASASVYVTWASAVAAAAAVNGPCTIFFDDSIESIPTIPAGNYDFGSEVTLQGISAGYTSGNTTTVAVDDGVTFPHSPLYVANLFLINTSPTLPLFVNMPVNGAITLINTTVIGLFAKNTTGIFINLVGQSALSDSTLITTGAADIVVNINDASNLNDNACQAGRNVNLSNFGDNCLVSLIQQVGEGGAVTLQDPQALDPQGVISSGITAVRPPLDPTSYIGSRFFDTTLGIPIWWNGTIWVNAVGVGV